MAVNNIIINNPEDPVSLLGKPDVKFTDEFDAAVYTKGYPVWWDQMMPCPCKEKLGNSPRVTCKNCHGRGFILSKRLETRAVIQQMNASTQYKDWSIERVGTASITALSKDRYSYMDRITLFDATQQISQLAYPITLSDNKVIALLDYPPIELLDIRMFNGDDNPLLIINPEDIIISDEGELDLENIKDKLYVRGKGDYTISSATGLAIRYTFHPSYHIIDSTRDIMISPIDGANKEQIRYKFPCHYVGMKSHLVVGEGNLVNLGKDVTNNSVKVKKTEIDFMGG